MGRYGALTTYGSMNGRRGLGATLGGALLGVTSPNPAMATCRCFCCNLSFSCSSSFSCLFPPFMALRRGFFVKSGSCIGTSSYAPIIGGAEEGTGGRV